METETILLAVTGMSPAVITETVWALANEEEPVIPSRVIAVTTVAGRTVIERELFSPRAEWDDRSVWQVLREKVCLLRGLDPETAVLNFDPVRVFTVPDPLSGRAVELVDLRSRLDNEAAADFLLEQVRSLVENTDTRVVASLAGGRKTMGALLYSCMTLVGRETDRLTHVLVDDPFDTLPGFWFPAQPAGKLIRPATGSRPAVTVEPSQAKVELADVPFVPLRNLFLRELGRTAGTFSRLVESARATVRQRASEELRLVIDSARQELLVNERPIKLAPLEQLVLLFLSRRAKQGEPPFPSYKDAVDPLNEFRKDTLESRPDDNYGDWRHLDSLSAACDDRTITKAVSGLREKLRALGGPANILATCLPEKGRCSLDVAGSLVHVR